MALLGALVVQPLVVLLVFLIGVVFGAGSTNFVRRTEPVHGWQGGENAVGLLLMLYESTFGMLPVVLSGAGAGLAVTAWYVVRRSRGRPDNQPPREPPSGTNHPTHSSRG